MLVILTDEHILSTKQVCQNCLLADQRGQPRWRGGQLGCGQATRKLTENQPDQYQCQMGFRLANVE